jgi:hypothetical protein
MPTPGPDMIFEVVLLALASTIRPTSLAAVSALIARDSRRTLMLAYVTVGMAFTILFGVIVVSVFHGVHIEAGTSRTMGIADTIGGAMALLFGFAVLAGVVRQRQDREPGAAGSRSLGRLDERITVRVAALAGPLTHIPGIFYLVALNVIVAHNPLLPGGLLAVAIYNAIWFAVPIAALVLSILDPERAQDLLRVVQAWAKRHSRTIVLATCFVVGGALLIRGLAAL